MTMITAPDLKTRILALGGVALEMSDEEIDGIDTTTLTEVLDEFGSSVLMLLPPRERLFMDWLKDVDPAVFTDLWGDETPVVSLHFIEAFKRADRGFIICELESCNNYYFTERHIKPEAREGLPGILDRAAGGKQLSIGEVLLFEILQHPIDIWHFCYKYGVSVEKGKAAVAELAGHDWLVHLTAREDLARYINE
jgi:hypothetical protein